MKMTTKQLSILLYCLLSSIIYASPIDVSFEKINNRHGLSSDEITKICQDAEGFIWIATNDGLNYYTGTEIISYRPTRNEENSLSTASIRSICATPDNKLWIATEKQGIDILDRQSNTITRVTTTSEGLQLMDNNINDMLCDSKGNMWLGSTLGVVKYNIYTKESKNYLINNKRLYVNALYETKEGEILCGTWGNALYRLDKKSDSFVYLEIPELSKNTNIKSLFQDTNGTLWVGTWGKGLYKVSRKNSEVISSEHILIFNDNYSKGHTYQIIYDMDQDKNGKLWLGTDIGLGIIKNPKAEAVEIDWIKPGDGPNDFVAKDASNLFIDAANTIWIGTQGDGVSRLDFNTSMFTTYTALSRGSEYGSNIFSSFWYFNNELYTGTRAFGFGKYNIEEKTFTTYKEMPEFEGLNTLNKEINSILQCSYNDDRYWWLLTRYMGIVKYDIKERKAHQLNTPNLGGRVTCFLLEEDKVWIGKNTGLMLLTYDPNSTNKVFPYSRKTYKPDTNNPESMRSQNVSKIIRDKDGRLWVSYFDGGIDEIIEGNTPDENIFSHVTKDDKEYYDYLPIQTMYEDSRGHIWLGTAGEGLWLFKKETKQFINFKDLTSIKGEMIFGIIEDNDKRLWISTNKGISSFNIIDLNTPYATDYNAEDGLQGNIFHLNSVCKSPEGNIIFGGYHGFNLFSPKTIKHNTYIPPLAFTDFEVDRKPIKVSYTDEQELVVDHNSTSFLIAFSALSYTKSINNHYQYKLEGYDQGWVIANKGTNNAIYGKIPPGNYTFKVKGSNNNGVWNQKPLEVKVRVKKSPYRTIFAYIIYALLFAGALWVYLYYTQRNFKLQQAYKDEQSERLRFEKINEFKLKFFTNISHELLTPLSIISNAIEQFIDNRPKDSKDLAIVQRNTNRLTRLINQLLDFRKEESTSSRLKVCKNDVNFLISSLKDNFLPLCEKKGISFIVKGKVEDDIYIDNDKVDKILHNILSNAFKHTPEDGAITLNYATRFVGKDEFLSISIGDSGKGIPENLMDQIFERFYRIDDRKHESGAGIGLAFTKSLVNRHKGTIKANNNEQGGAVFTFDIPVSEWAYNQDEMVSDDELPTEVEYSFAEEMDEIKIPLRDTRESNSELPKVLLVEDNHDMRTIMRNFLSKYFEIYESENGIQGLETLNSVDIELIVSDIMMPEMDGLTFCRKVKTNVTTSHIPVILTTAKRTQENFIEGYEAQADSYVTKPVNLQLLMVRIINLLEQRRKLHAIFSDEKAPDVKELNINNLDQQLLDKVNLYIKDNLSNTDLTVVTLAKHVGISNSVLYRKVKSFAGMSPNEYIRSHRLNYGAELLRKGLNPSEATYECGFSDPSYFGACFKKQFGVPPKKFIESL